VSVCVVSSTCRFPSLSPLAHDEGTIGTGNDNCEERQKRTQTDTNGEKNWVNAGVEHESGVGDESNRLAPEATELMRYRYPGRFPPT